MTTSRTRPATRPSVDGRRARILTAVNTAGGAGRTLAGTVVEGAAAVERTLVVYYSMTGNTRRLAEEIRTAVAGDLEEIREPRPRHGFSGVMRALLDLVLRRDVPIEPVRHSPSDYALVILGGPVWGGRMAPPVQAYALRHGLQASQVAFFCTMGGRGAEAAFARLAKDCGRQPVATLALDAAHLDPATHALDLQRFAGSSHPAAA